MTWKHRPGSPCSARDFRSSAGWKAAISSDSRWARGEDTEALQKFARELVALDPHVILSSSTPSTAALVQETRSIPIVFAIVVDPIGSGFVANLDHPGGNVTGFTNVEPTMAGKWLELLKEIAPHVRRAAFLYNPASAPYFELLLSPFKTAAASLGVEAIASPVHDRSDLELAITALTRVPNGGIVVMTDSYMLAQRAEVTSLALRYRLPLVSPYRAYAELGGLLSYGASSLDNYRRASIYADRILKGIKPSELPVQVPVQFQLVVNQGARPRTAVIVLLARRRGDRMMRREFSYFRIGRPDPWLGRPEGE